MNEDAPLAANTGDLRHRLNDSRLIVRQHHRHQAGVGTQSLNHALRTHLTRSLGRNDGHLVSAPLQLLHGFEDRWMFDRGCDNVMTTGGRHGAKDRGIVRLGPTAGKDDVSRGRGDQSRHRLAGILDPAARHLAFFMNARSVTVYVGQRLMQRLENGGMDRRSGVVVEVDAHQRSLTGTSMKRTLLAVAVALALLAPNILAQTNNPADPAKPPADQAPVKQDPGIRKLSRRERKEKIKNLSEKYQEFLKDVEPIMQQSELDTFLLLETDPQREIYITEFWRRRDIAQGTTNHTFRDQYYDRLESVKEKFKYVSSDRSRIYLIHGEPSEVIDSDCRLLQPIQDWSYLFSPGLGHDIRFVFYVPRLSSDYKLWVPYAQDSMAELVSQDASGTDIDERRAVQYVFGPISPYSTMTNLEYTCKNGDEIIKAIYQSQMNKTDIMKVFNPPEVNEEDVHKILRSVVLANPNATKLSADFAIQFPAKQGSRTDAQMTVLVPRAQLTMKDVDGTKLYSLDVTGEVLKDDQLFENYRYRFDYPGDIKDEKVAVVIDRFLRPADYKARIRVLDPNSNAEAIIEKAITVPELLDTPEQRKQKENAATALAALKDDIESNTTRLRIIPMADDLLSGIQHIETLAYGEDIKAVEFYLDSKKVMIKRQPPYTLDLDFGAVPRLHRVRAVALNEKGEPLAGDELLVNTGNEPFRVRIVSPRVALNAHGKTRVEMAVNVPDGKKLDNVELFLNDTRMATLFGPPWVQTVDIPKTEGVGYLRVVATLKDEPSQPPVEDLVMINSPQFMEEVNVHLIELPTTVIRNGRPVNDA